ncbi:MAG: Rieske (2Fe-2S) protein, partial [Candidatus Methylomirabilis sp.]|nr:Rieske (2Fe-2S) protein [Deltaproteobacteria bacterium]
EERARPCKAEPAGEWIEVTKADLAPGEHRGVKVAPKTYVLIANVGGRYCAIDDSCEHSGQLLSEGELTEGGLIVCPGHFYEIDVRNGDLVNPRGACDNQTCYAVEVRDGAVWVDASTLKAV